MDGRGWARQGGARRGMAWDPLRRVIFKVFMAWSGRASRGVARRGVARLGQARHGVGGDLRSPHFLTRRF